jgi:hypothetical protein
MSKSAKLTRALALRDAALLVVKRRGEWEKVKVAKRAGPGSGDMKFLSVHIGNLSISYRPSFQRVDVPLPYGLDVWVPSKKVMNIGWDAQGNIDLVSLRPGAWEAELIALANGMAE